MKLNRILIALSVVLTAGCTSAPSSNPNTDISLENSEALAALVNISVEARDELRLIAKMQEAKNLESLTEEQHKQKQSQALAVPPGFEKVIEFGIQDQSTKAARAIAKMAGYDYKEYGKPLSTFQEPWVNIPSAKKPLVEFLREVGMQTGSAVRIEVYPEAKLIRYVYKNVE
ncbi:DotD/TraH family lipoprotein [Vibrio splendidus]|nr:DotD/TraH family lipoprotein [Vibrio splendidus]MCC4883265.1 DotD/TraH family lipoprotein [Vibrio splendidus]